MSQPDRLCVLTLDSVQHGFYDAAGAPALGDSLFTLRQVHSTRVVTLTAGQHPADLADVPADALISAIPGVAVGVVTADCAPVLIAAPDIGCVAAVHAGRAGALDGIVGKVIVALKGRGAATATLRVGVGARIMAPAYEVGEALFATLPAVARHRADDGRACCDLDALIGADLCAHGVRREQVAWLPIDTATSNRHHSYRRDGQAAGRQLSVIAWMGEA